MMLKTILLNVVVLVCLNQIKQAWSISCYTCGTELDCDPKKAKKIQKEAKTKKDCVICRTVYPLHDKGVVRDCWTQTQLEKFNSKEESKNIATAGECFMAAAKHSDPLFPNLVTNNCFCGSNDCNNKPRKEFKNVKCYQCKKENGKRPDKCKLEDAEETSEVAGQKCLYCAYSDRDADGKAIRSCVPILPAVGKLKKAIQVDKCFEKDGKKTCICDGPLCNASQSNHMTPLWAITVTILMGLLVSVS